MLTVLRDRRGQTLLEVVAAVAILTIGAVSLTALAVQSLSLARLVRERVTALNLAREGVEWARSVRDSNWIRNDATVPWNDGLANGSDTSVVLGWNEATRSFTTNWTPGLSDLGASSNFTRLYRTASGAYTTTAVGTTPSLFHRIVLTNPVCWDLAQSTLREQAASEVIASDGQPCPAGLTAVGIDAHAYVRYTDGRTYTLQLEEHLYNWREGSVEP